MTGIIDRMEREGLVARERSTDDRRVVHIRLTEKGAKLAREIPVEPMEIFRGALGEPDRGRAARAAARSCTKIAKRVAERS